MTVFTQCVNPTTGKTEWQLQPDDYDYHQQVARSAYADMLHDTERNVLYYSALKVAVAAVKARGERCHVLDIGTGTGLLSMMAVKSGADQVTACEAFKPMAACARDIISDNGMSADIELIEKRSTDIILGVGGDMVRRANVLITEVFDTELIGEGAISTFTHAHKHLLTHDCIVIPSYGYLYVQLVESDLLRSWNRLSPLPLPNSRTLHHPTTIEKCGGSAAVHDIQMSQLTQFKPLTQPIQVFKFDFTRELEFNRRTVETVEVTSAGACEQLLMWWDLEMLPSSLSQPSVPSQPSPSLLSCAPAHVHSSGSAGPWRDHWMQAVYYLPQLHNLVDKEQISLASHHDEYSLWFNIRDNNSSPSIPRPVCECGSHIVNSRSRLGMLNCSSRNRALLTCISGAVSRSSRVLVLGEGAVLPSIVALCGAAQVYVMEPDNHIDKQLLEDYTQTNNIHNIHVVKEGEVKDLHISLVLAEPYFYSAVLPWHSLQLWYKYVDLQLQPTPRLLPAHARIRGVAVQWRDLWKIRAPLGTVEGFNLEKFDKLIESSSDISDECVEPQPLWEYPATALSTVLDICTINLSGTPQKQTLKYQHTIPLHTSGVCNGVALWMDWCFDSEENEAMWLGSGPIADVVVGEQIVWDTYSKQGVYLLKHHIQCTGGQSLHSNVTFSQHTGEFTFNFDIKT